MAADSQPHLLIKNNRSQGVKTMNHIIKVSGQQKVITVKKAPADKNNKYCVINQEALHKAMKALHKCAAGLPLWMYIAEN